MQYKLFVKKVQENFLEDSSIQNEHTPSTNYIECLVLNIVTNSYIILLIILNNAMDLEQCGLKAKNSSGYGTQN